MTEANARVEHRSFYRNDNPGVERVGESSICVKTCCGLPSLDSRFYCVGGGVSKKPSLVALLASFLKVKQSGRHKPNE